MRLDRAICILLAGLAFLLPSPAGANVHVKWAATAGFYWEDNPGTGFLGDATGRSALYQLIYSADNIIDPADPEADGYVSGDDVVIDAFIYTENGVSNSVDGLYDDYGWFTTGQLADDGGTNAAGGYIYGRVWQDATPGVLDWYYDGPLEAALDINTNSTPPPTPQVYDLNVDLVNGDPVDENQATSSTVTLIITSAYGTASPPVGTHVVAQGTTVTCQVAPSVVYEGDTTRHLCTGWAGAGSVPPSGTDTNTGSLTLTSNSWITWQWTTDFALYAEAADHGAVSLSNGWFAAGTTSVVSALPDPGYHFTSWSGDVPAAETNDNPLSLLMNSAKTLTAVFASGPGPSWWYSYNVVTAPPRSTNDFAAANQGQLKWIASQAQRAMADTDRWRPGQAEEAAITNMVAAFPATGNYRGVNIGQVKRVASPFYDWLLREEAVENPPWLNAAATNDYGAVNIGQLKNVFSFDIPD